MAVDGGIIINIIHKVQLKCINFHLNEQKYILGLYKMLLEYFRLKEIRYSFYI